MSLNQLVGVGYALSTEILYQMLMISFQRVLMFKFLWLYLKRWTRKFSDVMDSENDVLSTHYLKNSSSYCILILSSRAFPGKYEWIMCNFSGGILPRPTLRLFGGMLWKLLQWIISSQVEKNCSPIRKFSTRLKLRNKQ